MQYTEYCERKKFNLFTLEPLIESKVVRKRMDEKMADSGISLDYFQHSLKMGGRDGLIRILSDRVKCKRKG